MDGPLLNEYLATTTVGGLFACVGLAFLLIQERTTGNARDGRVPSPRRAWTP